MREILFKAKRIKTGDWVTGLYSKSFMGSHVISLKADGVLITDQIDPETLCQFTGARTADNQRIFEGDKISFKCNDDFIHGHIIYVQELQGYFIETDDGFKIISEYLTTIVLKGNINDEK